MAFVKKAPNRGVPEARVDGSAAVESPELRWRLKVFLAFSVVYLVWGSTYLAIRIGVATVPPLLFAGVRFLSAGLVLSIYARLTGQKFPSDSAEWRSIFIVGLLLLVVANGLVVWGEKSVPSNQAALIAATTALWLTGLGRLGTHGQRLGLRATWGLVFGFGGVAFLLAPRGGLALDHLLGQLAILLAALSWAGGSIYVKNKRPATPALMSAAMQSLFAGLILCLVGLLIGEGHGWQWTPKAVVALAYLAVFGSGLAYAAYVWLLHSVSPAALSTYAYVNPMVAVVLGWWVLDESLGPRQITGMLIIVGAVILVSTCKRRAA